MYYLNNAGAGLMSDGSRKAILEHLDLEQKVGAYIAAEEREYEMQAFYARAARLLNAKSESSIFYNDSASRGWNVILNSIDIKKDDRIITFSSEFGTNLVTLYNLSQRTGAELIIIQCDDKGKFSWEELENAVTDNTALLCVSHAVAHGSIVNPIVEIGSLINEKAGCTYVVDGCQAAGQIPIDVQIIGCDAYICTGRKWLRGPRGTGFAYIKEKACIRSNHFDLAAADLIIDTNGKVTGISLINSARQFELWERSVALMLGFSEAIFESCQAIESGKLAVANNFANKLRDEVSANPNFRLIGEVKSPSCTIGFICNDPSLEGAMRAAFNKHDISYSSMGIWDCPLHFPKNGATTIFRLSPHYYTSIETIDAAVEAIRSI